jgi:3-oxoacyl-[acyl-carrier-protein] synthase-3
MGIDDVKKSSPSQRKMKPLFNASINYLTKLYLKTSCPMSIHELGNSSVATVPSLLSLLIRGGINQSIQGDILYLPL